MTLQPKRGECYICGRGGVSLVLIGATRMRHEECAPGSFNWCEWYLTLPESKRTDSMTLLYNHTKGIKS